MRNLELIASQTRRVGSPQLSIKHYHPPTHVSRIQDSLFTRASPPVHKNWACVRVQERASADFEMRTVASQTSSGSVDLCKMMCAY